MPITLPMLNPLRSSRRSSVRSANAIATAGSGTRDRRLTTTCRSSTAINVAVRRRPSVVRTLMRDPGGMPPASCWKAAVSASLARAILRSGSARAQARAPQ